MCITFRAVMDHRGHAGVCESGVPRLAFAAADESIFISP